MNVCVACGFGGGDSPVFCNIADTIGKWIADNGHNLVFGGCKDGLMGHVYSQVVHKGFVYAIQTEEYKDDAMKLEQDSQWCKIEIVKNANLRKNRFFELADVIVVIPGGIGTLDEMVTAISAKRDHELGDNVPIVVINYENFYAGIFDLFDRMIEDRLLSESVWNLFDTVDTVEDASKKLSSISNELIKKGEHE